MSERNGDKARFQRQRKRKILHRMRLRELRKALEHHKAIHPKDGETIDDLVHIADRASYSMKSPPRSRIQRRVLSSVADG